MQSQCLRLAGVKRKSVSTVVKKRTVLPGREWKSPQAGEETERWGGGQSRRGRGEPRP